MTKSLGKRAFSDGFLGMPSNSNQDFPFKNTISTITIKTGICQVVRFCRTTMFPAYDMIHLTSKKRIVFMDQAILAKVFGTMCNDLSKMFANIATHGSRIATRGPSPAASNAQSDCNGLILTSHPVKGRSSFRL